MATKKIKSEIEKYKSTSTPDLQKQIVEMKRELLDLRFAAVVGQLEDTAKVSKIKKDIARMMTIISSRAE